MSLEYSLNLLQDKIKNFQDLAKERIFNLGKIRVTLINPDNKTEETTISMGFYYLRNTIKEMLNSKIRLKDFNKLQQSIKRIFQKFIDINELINFDKGEDLFKKLNENDSISPFKLLFCDIFHERIKRDVFKNKCNELKKSVNNFNNFKENFKELNSKILNFQVLREKIEKYQKLLKSGNLKMINEENLEDFRLFRSFFPLNVNSEYLINIKNRAIIKL
ncbi:MAG: hypothetical protein ACFFDK_07640 [Promethearchaeota archaeon]